MIVLNDRILIKILLSLSLLLIVGIGIQHLRDKMGDRLHALETEIESIDMSPVSYTAAREVNYTHLNSKIAEKQNLWLEVVPPPPPPKKRAARPNLSGKLRGVTPSKRREIKKKGVVYVLIVTPQNPRGSFMGEGEMINGVFIHKIKEDVITFRLNFQKKDYFHDIPRK